MDIFTQLSYEHTTLAPVIESIQLAAEAGDKALLLARLAAARTALTSELDAHIRLEEDNAFNLAEQAVGAGLVDTFREEHTEIQALRDEMLAQAEQDTASFTVCLRFCDLIQTHMLREDTMLFPSVVTAL